ncbi:MAG TPA: hypothetical protein VHG10_05410 [Glycomyces sp.]|nr:hypothetical protein [Glycomyces sp.]
MEECAGEPMGMGTALVRTAFLVDAVYADAVRDFDLTVPQAQLLCVLMARPYGMFERRRLRRIHRRRPRPCFPC